MEYYLVLTIFAKTMTIVPEKYSPFDACDKAGQAFEAGPGQHFTCIPAPTNNYKCRMAVSDDPSGSYMGTMKMIEVPCTTTTGK